MTAYWRTLSSAGITAQRLASFDRAITSEPRFSGQQAAGLQRDLTAYLATLRAVHGGDDLASAINNVLGYVEVDMKGKGGGGEGEAPGGRGGGFAGERGSRGGGRA